MLTLKRQTPIGELSRTRLRETNQPAATAEHFTSSVIEAVSRLVDRESKRPSFTILWRLEAE